MGDTTSNRQKTEKVSFRVSKATKNRIESFAESNGEQTSDWVRRSIKYELDGAHDIDTVEQTLLYLAAGGTLTFLLTTALGLVGVVGSGIVIYLTGVFAALLLSGYGARKAFVQVVGVGDD